MRKFLTPLFAASLAVGASLASHAITLPSAIVTLGDGETHDFSGAFVPTATGFTLPSKSFTFADGSIVTVSATSGTTSSFLSYGFGVTNANAPETYDFSVSAPILPSIAGSKTQSSVNGTGTDNTGNGGTIGPINSQSTVQQAFGDNGLLGLNLGPSYTLAPSGTVPSFFTFGSYSGTGVLTAPTTSLGLNLGIGVPGGGDVFSFTGRLSASSVPEPGALALLTGVALSGAGFLLRKRRR